MSRTMRKSLLYSLLLVAGITFGMQLAESGTNRIYDSASAGRQFDPASSGTAGFQQSQETFEGSPQIPQNSQKEFTDWTTTAAANQQTITERLQTPDSLLLPPPEQAPVDRFADKAANLLQQVSQHSIYWVASLFKSGE